MITVELLQSLELFAGIPEARLAHVADHAADILAAPGDYVLHEGEVPSFFVIISGTIEVTKRAANVERVVALRHAGEFFAEIPMMLRSPSFANARAQDAVRVMRLDAVAFSQLLNDSPALATAVMQAMRERITALQQLAIESPAAAVTVFGDSREAACHDVRDFLYRNHVTFDWIEASDPVPKLRMNDGRELVAPSPRELAIALGLRVTPSQSQYDLVVVGGGPAGLAASVYGASEGLSTLMIEQEAPGGQAGTSSRIENYLGFPAGLSGDDLGARALEQALRLGAETIVTREAVALRPSTPHHTIMLDGGDTVVARSVVLATGVTWRKFDVPGAEGLTGRGIYYGASRAEAPTVRGKDIYLIGAGNSAGQAAVFFAAFARSVTILVRGASLSASMSTYLIEQIERLPTIRIELNTHVVSVDGEDRLQSIVVQGPHAQERRETEAVFVFIGADADTHWLPAELLRDERGYILSGLEMMRDPRAAWPLERDPYLLETSVPVVFVAGDVRHGSVKRVAAGVGEGSMAIAFVHQALAAEEAARL